MKDRLNSTSNILSLVMAATLSLQVSCGPESEPADDLCTTDRRVACQADNNSCTDDCATATDPSECICECTNDLFYCYDALNCDQNPAGSPQDCD